MTGKELIEWIREHQAEDANFVVQYRDCEGDWPGVEEPYLIFVKDDNTVLL